MFDSLQPLPPDPILGRNAAFKEDNNPKKVDLGIGVYKDEDGATPVMKAVKEAEKRKHEYVTIEHVLLSLVKDKQIGAILIDFKTATSALIKDIED